MSIGKSKGAVVCALLVAANLAGGATSASAQAPAPADEPTKLLVQGKTAMYVGDIDEVQARKVGNRVARRDGYVILIDGSTGKEIARVPDKKNPPKGDLSTRTYAYGNCGYSYYFLYNYRSYDNVYHLETGFHVYGKAYDFSWRTGVDQPNGGYNTWNDSGPMWPDDDWNSGLKEEYSPWDGRHYGRVTSGVAFLTNGSVCYAGKPYDSEYVT